MPVYALTIDQNNFFPSKFSDLATFVNLLIPLLMTGGALIFLVMLLYGGFVWITAGDNAESVKKSQKILTFAAVGLVIVFLSYLAVKLIGIILNVNQQIKL